MARPRIVIDWKVVDALCSVSCTLAEIAGHFGCSEDTIERAVQREHKMGFAEYYRVKSGAGAIALRRKQFQVAMSGNATMLIWLGKVRLNQKETIRSEVSGPDGKPMEMNTNDPRERVSSRIAGIAARIGTNGDSGGSHG